MIRGYERAGWLGYAPNSLFQLGSAFLAGLIAGGILLIVPAGSPWSGITFFSPVVMGRTIPSALPLIAVWAIHLLVSVVYGLGVSAVAAGFKKGRALLAGAIVGLLLYGLNMAIVSIFAPSLRGNEFGVGFTHIVFGLIAGGAYRGLLQRRLSV